MPDDKPLSVHDSLLTGYEVDGRARTVIQACRAGGTSRSNRSQSSLRDRNSSCSP